MCFKYFLCVSLKNFFLKFKIFSKFDIFSWTGAGQMCCYDYEGWLMFSDDFEYNDQYLRFYSAGVPYRFVNCEFA